MMSVAMLSDDFLSVLFISECYPICQRLDGAWQIRTGSHHKSE